MATCSYCRSTILFGGKREGNLRFCSTSCQERSFLNSVVEELPAEVVEASVRSTHSGNCPKCHGRGPVDVHTSYRVWSAVVLSSCYERQQVCCSSCGWKSKMGDALFCLLLGWWGLPFGLILTPVQIGRNLAGLASSPDYRKPSNRLRRIVRAQLATSLLLTQEQDESGVEANADKSRP